MPGKFVVRHKQGGQYHFVLTAEKRARRRDQRDPHHQAPLARRHRVREAASRRRAGRGRSSRRLGRGVAPAAPEPPARLRPQPRTQRFAAAGRVQRQLTRCAHGRDLLSELDVLADVRRPHRHVARGDREVQRVVLAVLPNRIHGHKCLLGVSRPDRNHLSFTRSPFTVRAEGTTPGTGPHRPRRHKPLRRGYDAFRSGRIGPLRHPLVCVHHRPHAPQWTCRIVGNAATRGDSWPTR
jgi:hypothetical protein